MKNPPVLHPPLSPEQARRTAIARHPGIPVRLIDIVLAQGTAPYTLLFDHIRHGGRSREHAISALRQKAPKSCRDWLDHIERRGL